MTKLSRAEILFLLLAFAVLVYAAATFNCAY